MENKNSGAGRKLIIGSTLLVVFILLLVVYFVNAACFNVPGMGACQRVLFIGNSYTYVNDLPGMFASLARSGGHKVQVGMAAHGSWSLADHAASSATLNQIRSTKWDIVILQEQSEIPAMEQTRALRMYPAAQTLVSLVEGAGAKPLLFMTWAHLAGLPDFMEPDYQSMQTQIERTYMDLGNQLNVSIAPVGYAWLLAHAEYPQLGLWQQDGSHPSQAGTYLAACVFYAAIFHQSPEGLTYLGHVAQSEAFELQTIAAKTVLTDPKQWNLP